MIYTANKWKDYRCIDAGDGEKLEIWKDTVLRRPDPQAIWPKSKTCKAWKEADAVYHRSNKGGGQWEYHKKLPEFWTINYKDLTFRVSPTGFKHTGIFPEQAVNWDWMSNLIKAHQDEEIRVLNLFAYTGCATMACSKAGASEVVHVDASKGMVGWAKENAVSSGLKDAPIQKTADSIYSLVSRIQNPDGSIGKLLVSDSLYNSLTRLSNSLDSLVSDISRDPKKYIKISIF